MASIRQIVGVRSTNDMFPDNTSTSKVKVSTEKKIENESKRKISDNEIKTLSHFEYDEEQDQLISHKSIESTSNELLLGDQHTISSGSENVFFTNSGSNTNYFPMWGGLKDQSIEANQGASGVIPPSGRVFSDMTSLSLGGNPAPDTSISYSGTTKFDNNISGLGITTVSAENIDDSTDLEYRLKINNKLVYKQTLPRDQGKSNVGEDILAGDTVKWFFNHPIDIVSGTNVHAEIQKVRRSDNTELGLFNVRKGDTLEGGVYRYQTILHNRVFEDKDLELISPYLKYKSMDFKLDSTGSSVLLRDLSLGSDNVLAAYNINELKAIEVNNNIQIKVRNGKKIIIESLPITNASINGFTVSSVLGNAVSQVNDLFSNTSGFLVNDSFVNGFSLDGNNLTLTLSDNSSYTVDVTSLRVDQNKFVHFGSLEGSDLTLTMTDSTKVRIPVADLAIDTDTTVMSGVSSGTDLVLTMSDNSTLTIDATSLYTGDSNEVVSGNVIGKDLVLFMADASQITIDASNMINGASLSAEKLKWAVSYGSTADTSVSVGSIKDELLNSQPFKFINKLHLGEEFRFNMPTSQDLILGLWSGSQSPTNEGGLLPSNYSTAFAFDRGTSRFVDSSNTIIRTLDNYIPANSSMGIKFGADQHLTLVHYTVLGENEIAKTNTPISEDQFFLQMGGYADAVFPNGYIKSPNFSIVHDHDDSEAGLINGVEALTVIKSDFSISAGEKFLFTLRDEIHQSDIYFGTNYSGAATGNSNAVQELESEFLWDSTGKIYFSGWDFTYGSSDNYNTYGSDITLSLRYNEDNTLTINNESYGGSQIAIANENADGNPLNLYIGFAESVSQYSDIPAVSKQLIFQRTQPIAQFGAQIYDVNVTVQEGEYFSQRLNGGTIKPSEIGFVDKPYWLGLQNNSNGFYISFLTPEFVEGGQNTYEIDAYAATILGGRSEFKLTVNVEQNSYSNTHSLAGGFAYTNGSNVEMFEEFSWSDADPWSLTAWIKDPVYSMGGKVFFYYGRDYYEASSGGVISMEVNVTDFIIKYGDFHPSGRNNGIKITYPGVLSDGWNHIGVKYAGRGYAANDGMNWEVAINGQPYPFFMANVVQTPYSDGIDMFASKLIINSRSTFTGVDPLDMGLINQIALWDHDMVNMDDAYNRGKVFDLNTLDSYQRPKHFWEFPVDNGEVSDLIGNCDLITSGVNLSQNTPPK
tara:strand:- start:22466 stop:26071 length:3606 start_codon:yes stop_codon:yes gene_type:complete